MEQHRFGSTQREVAAIGQGTWYIDNGDRASAITSGAELCSIASGAELWSIAKRGGYADRRFAPRTRSRHDPYRHVIGIVWCVVVPKFYTTNN